MKILQLHDEPWDSGLAHYALTLSAELARRGRDVRFWAASGSHAARQARFMGLKTREMSKPWLSLPAWRAEIRREGFAVINAHTGSSHSLAAALAAGTRAAVVRTRGDARAPKGHALARALARRTKLFIGANGAITRQLRELFPGSRVEEVPQGLQPQPEAPLRSEPVVGILGRLDPVKGHEDLIAAARLLAEEHPQARFFAAGDGGLREPLARAAAALGGKFTMLGYVPDAGRFIQDCRIGVVASRGSEAVSRAALEWMGAGRPLVATKVGCLPELVEHGVTGLLVEPGRPDRLAAALEELLDEPARAEALGKAARARFLARYTLEGFAARTDALYAEAAR